MKYELSVIIPVYNVEKYLDTCIESVLNSTIKNIEIVLVNDGSTDTSESICQKYEKHFDNIKLINQENKGLSEARNTGLQHATGKYIAFLDSDDYVENNFYEKLLDIIIRKNADIAVGNVICFDENNHFYPWGYNNLNFATNKDVVDTIKDRQWNMYACACWNKIYKKELFIKYNLKFPKGLYIEDVPITFITSVLSKKIALDKSANMYYRQRSTSIMADAKTDRKTFDIFKIYDYTQHLYDEVKKQFTTIEINEYQKILDRFKLFNIYVWYCSTNKIYRAEFYNLMRNEFKKINIKNNEYIDSQTKKTYRFVMQFNDYSEIPLCRKKYLLFGFINFLQIDKYCDYKNIKIFGFNINKIISISDFSCNNKIYKMFVILGLKFKFRNKQKEQILNIEKKVTFQEQELNVLIKSNEEQNFNINQLKTKNTKLNFLLHDLVDYLLKININTNNIKDFISINNKSNNLDFNIKNELEKLENFYFLPNRGNLGDILIATSEYQYFNFYNINYKIYREDCAPQRKFNFVYGGGGLWTSYYDYKNIIEIFRNKNLNKAIILPSSFNNCDDLFDVLDERFVVFCREEQSYNYCTSKNNKAKFILADDMAFGLNIDFYAKPDNITYTRNVDFLDDKIIETYKNYKIIYNYIEEINKKLTWVNNKSVGFFIRTDIESNTNWDKYNIAKNIDLSQLIGSHCLDASFSKLLTMLFLKMISIPDIIVSDRLHVCIGALLLGKKVCMIDNSYGKLSSVYKYSCADKENVYICNADSLLSKINEITMFDSTNIVCVKNIPNNYIDFLNEYLTNNQEIIGEQLLWIK